MVIKEMGTKFGTIQVSVYSNGSLSIQGEVRINRVDYYMYHPVKLHTPPGGGSAPRWVRDGGYAFRRGSTAGNGEVTWSAYQIMKRLACEDAPLLIDQHPEWVAEAVAVGDVVHAESLRAQIQTEAAALDDLREQLAVLDRRICEVGIVVAREALKGDAS